MKEIQLKRGMVTFVDDEDFEYLSQWKWRLHGGYASRSSSDCGKRVEIYMHRVIARTPQGSDTDHINLDKLDNRKENLRICSHSENMRNMLIPKHNKSGYKGVNFDKNSGKWKAQISVDNEKIYLGIFNDLIEAAKAYNAAAIKYYGNYALLNET